MATILNFDDITEDLGLEVSLRLTCPRHEYDGREAWLEGVAEDLYDDLLDMGAVLVHVNVDERGYPVRGLRGGPVLVLDLPVDSSTFVCLAAAVDGRETLDDCDSLACPHCVGDRDEDTAECRASW